MSGWFSTTSSNSGYICYKDEWKVQNAQRRMTGQTVNPTKPPASTSTSTLPTLPSVSSTSTLPTLPSVSSTTPKVEVKKVTKEVKKVKPLNYSQILKQTWTKADEVKTVGGDESEEVDMEVDAEMDAQVDFDLTEEMDFDASVKPIISKQQPRKKPPMPKRQSIVRFAADKVKINPHDEERIWTDRVAPVDSKNVWGNTSEIHQLRSWIEKRKAGEDTEKIVALLYGRPGVGKTTTAHLLLKEAGFRVQEFNVSLERTRNKVYSQVRSLLTRKSPVESTVRSAVVLDEIDGSVQSEKKEQEQADSINGQNQHSNTYKPTHKSKSLKKDDGVEKTPKKNKMIYDKTMKTETTTEAKKEVFVAMGAVDAVIELVEEAEVYRAKHGKLPNWPPIICIANEKSSRTMRRLGEFADVYQFKALSDNAMAKHIRSVGSEMFLPLTDRQVVEVRKQTHGDARHAVLLLDSLLTTAYSHLDHNPQPVPGAWVETKEADQWKFTKAHVKWALMTPSEREQVITYDKTLAILPWEQIPLYTQMDVGKKHKDCAIAAAWTQLSVEERWKQVDASVQWKFLPEETRQHMINLHVLGETSKMETNSSIWDSVSNMLYKPYNTIMVNPRTRKVFTKEELKRGASGVTCIFNNRDGKEVIGDEVWKEFATLYMQDADIMRLMIQENIVYNHVRPCCRDCAEFVKGTKSWSLVNHKDWCTIQCGHKFSEKTKSIRDDPSSVPSFVASNDKPRYVKPDPHWYRTSSVHKVERRHNQSIQHVSDMLDVMSDLDILTTGNDLSAHLPLEAEASIAGLAAQQYRYPTSKEHWDNNLKGDIRFTQFFERKKEYDERRGQLADWQFVNYMCRPHPTPISSSAASTTVMPSFDIMSEEPDQTHESCTCTVAQQIKKDTVLKAKDMSKLCPWCLEHRFYVSTSSFSTRDVHDVIDVQQAEFLRSAADSYDEKLLLAEEGESYFGKPRWEFLKQWKPVSEQYAARQKENNDQKASRKTYLQKKKDSRGQVRSVSRSRSRSNSEFQQKNHSNKGYHTQGQKRYQNPRSHSKSRTPTKVRKNQTLTTKSSSNSLGKSDSSGQPSFF